jgi:hypothetical protein
MDPVGVSIIYAGLNSTPVRNYGDVLAGRKTPGLAMCLWSWDLPANTSLYLRTRVLSIRGPHQPGARPADHMSRGWPIVAIAASIYQ